VGIHHPGGDVKKISIEDDPPVKDGDRWRVQWDAGITQGGSSGSPLYDPAGRLIGHLQSGSSACIFPDAPDFYGRLAPRWSLLEPYLDPCGTGALGIDGLDPATVVPGPFAVTGIVPSAIETLYPGTRKPVRILGAGFTDATLVAVDGVALPAEQYVHSGATWRNVDMPQLDAGRHTFTVTEGSETRSIDFDVVPPTEPRLQVSTGDLNAPIVTFAGGDLIHADLPGHVHYCFWSLSNAPSVHPWLTLALGAGFTQVVSCRVQAIPPAGWLPVHHPIRPNSFSPGTVIYVQAACLNHGLPLHTSDLQTVQVIF
jgi:hypothetical protein